MSFNWDFLHNPIPVGALTEVSGPAGGGKTELILEYLARRFSASPSLRVAWIERQFTLYPPVLASREIVLEQVFFVDAGGSAEGALWASHQILRSGVFSAVVIAAEVRDTIALRRLQLAAEKAQASVFLLSDFPLKGSTWPIRLQLHTRRSSEGPVQVEVLKRGGERLNASRLLGGAV